jgi:hypothetical protein
MNASINPNPCPDCPLGERRGFLIHRKYYNLGYTIDHEKKPEHCRAVKITIEEGD